MRAFFCFVENKFYWTDIKHWYTAFYLSFLFCQKNLSLAINKKNNILNSDLLKILSYNQYGNQKDRYNYSETNNSCY